MAYYNSTLSEITPTGLPICSSRGAAEGGRAASGVQKAAATRAGTDLGHLAQAPRSSSADPTEARKTPLHQNLAAESEKVTPENTDSKEEKGIGLFLSSKPLVKQIIDFSCKSCHHAISHGIS